MPVCPRLVRRREGFLLVACGVEQRLVDLAVVDGHMLPDADPDDLLAFDPELLGDLFRRQVIRHLPVPPFSRGPSKTERAHRDALRWARDFRVTYGGCCPI